MRVLIVCSRRDYSPFTEFMAPFVYEQMKALQAMGIECRYIMTRKGVRGYSRAAQEIKEAIKSFSPDIVHAHYGLSGVVANIQRKVPVVTTYHGSDLNNLPLRMISWISIALSKANIVVSSSLKEKTLFHNNIHVIPCGIDISLLSQMSKEEARRNLGWDMGKRYILFSKEFHNKAKNYPLAKASVELYNERLTKDDKAELLEFIGYSREQVLWLYNAVDCVLMTSNHEGSPQFIKEAMACDCPIVSVDVGDVKEVIGNTSGCYIAERSPNDIADKLDKAIRYGRTEGRSRILDNYSADIVARRIIDVYKDVIENE